MISISLTLSMPSGLAALYTSRGVIQEATDTCSRGMAADGASSAGVVGRFLGTDRYLIVTVYKIAGI